LNIDYWMFDFLVSSERLCRSLLPRLRPGLSLLIDWFYLIGLFMRGLIFKVYCFESLAEYKTEPLIIWMT